MYSGEYGESYSLKEGSNTLRVPFGYDPQGSMVGVESAKKGVEYKCSCGSTLRLRGGKKVRKHFYHIANAECSLESAIHKAFKYVFQQRKTLTVPTMYGAKTLQFESVHLEKKLNDFIPDAIGYLNDVPYLVEFANTSLIDKKKQKKIELANLFCIEIYIGRSSIPNNEADIQEFLVGPSYRKVIHDPRYLQMRIKEEGLESHHQRRLQALESHYEKLQKRVDEDVRESIRKEYLGKYFKAIEKFRTQTFWYQRKVKTGAEMYHDPRNGTTAFVHHKSRINIKPNDV
jgi:hypothetical protein